MPAIVDRTGHKYGRLTVARIDAERTQSGRIYWLCNCECGNEKSVLATNLQSGHTVSCGCAAAGKPMIDRTGQRFGRLTVLTIDRERTKPGFIYWLCQCDCGKTTSVISGGLRKTISCGCAIGKYFDTKSDPLYPVWKSMVSRCTNPKNKSYKDYGAKGIRVCQRWMDSFHDFKSDMGPRPNGYTIERRDSTKDYGPENCRWATWKEQQRNRTNNRMLTLNGESKSIAEWEELTGIHAGTIRSRLKYGWSDERALTTPAAIKARASA